MKLLEYLIDEVGVDIDETDENGDTALHICVERNNSEGCEILLKHGARTDIANNVLQTVERLAESHGNEELLDLFLLYRHSEMPEHDSFFSTDTHHIFTRQKSASAAEFYSLHPSSSPPTASGASA
eukprot:CAMPEP_0113719122 /NCGR_PEP_ID=MMETSP0038_2-20120614/35611_1 /TAXON_ID=2898 /ORGANISM="Cryptomonas paramecium" /LENGTH=125 /DNA_ID=CAMNT_0000647403 /DNA_START=221 /DNA_END=594 /DNA_ORIENTATION=+ /assembly_acc=CAM_ASM_000170